MIITAVESPGFSLGRLVAAAEARGVRTRMLTRDADVRGAARDTVSGEDLVVTLVNSSELDVSQDPDLWARSALTAAIGLALDHQGPRVRALIRNRAALRTRLHERGLSRGPGRAFGPGTSLAEIEQSIGFPVVIRDSAGIADRDGWLARGAADLDAVWAAAAAGEMLGDVLTAEPYFDGPVFEVEALVWAGHTRIRSLTARSGDAQAAPEHLPQLTFWLSRVLRSIGFQRGFARVDVALTEQGFEAVTIEIRAGGRDHGEELCRALETGALAVFAEVVLERGLVASPSPKAGRALFYAGDVATSGLAQSAPAARPGPDGCVAVLLANGSRAESTLLTAMASSPSRRSGADLVNAGR